MMILTKATENHIQELVTISKSAFDSDIIVGATEVDGPPEYDSVEWHIEMMKQGHLFTAIIEDTILGGAILFIDENKPRLCMLEEFLYPLNFLEGGMGLI